MLVEQFACRLPEEGKGATRPEVDAGYRLRLRRVDQERMQVRSAHHPTRHRSIRPGTRPRSKARYRCAQWHHQLHAAIRQYAFERGRGRVALVHPDHLDEGIEWRPWLP